MKKLTKLICAIFALGIIFNAQNFVLGEENGVTNDEIQKLNNEISSRRDKIKELQDKQGEYSKAIQRKQKEQSSLINQISIIEDNIAKAELEVERTKIEIDQTNLEIKKNNLSIETREKEIAEEKNHISTVIRYMYKEDQVSTLEMMLMNDSLADFLNQIKYLEDINGEVVKSLDQLQTYKEDLEKQKVALGDKKKQLDELKNKLEQNALALENQSESKNAILTQARNSESEYQRLLNLAKQEQVRASSEIAGIEKQVRQKMASMKDSSKLESNSSGFVWPVPSKIVTTYFHDPDYPFRNVFEHPAIDIRAGQGTSVKAAASGYVARAKDAGKGYSYIMLVHADGLSTVYGHISKILVSEESYVSQGQTIGLSGGMPGTNGAGQLTTGPHLHFEVRLNGLPVNPLEYLQ
jgi:murein DD-endopeptidase MepM/ murein hydrolase activator NlpD